MERTLNQYDTIAGQCRATFEVKTKDYGTAWRILRPSSLTDQIMIKAKRIRTIQELSEQKIDEPVEGEFRAIINYGIMALIQLEKTEEDGVELEAEKALEWYDAQLKATRNLMIRKNHDYGEAWRDMRVSSITDMILMKLLRIKQIEDNDGRTQASEGLAANYQDIINYAFFALIQLEEAAQQKAKTDNNATQK